MGRVVDLCQTFEDRKVVGLLDEETNAMLELARCLPTDRRNSLEYTRGDGNKADCCASGKKGGFDGAVTGAPSGGHISVRTSGKRRPRSGNRAGTWIEACT